MLSFSTVRETSERKCEAHKRPIISIKNKLIDEQSSPVVRSMAFDTSQAEFWISQENIKPAENGYLMVTLAR